MVLIKSHKIVYSRLYNTFVPKKEREISTRRRGGVAPLTRLAAFLVILLGRVFFVVILANDPIKVKSLGHKSPRHPMDDVL